jgi:hypothetical protein
MTKKKIRNEKDDTEVKVEKFLKLCWREIVRYLWLGRKYLYLLIEWLFFYKPKNKVDKIEHIILVISWFLITKSIIWRD